MRDERPASGCGTIRHRWDDQIDHQYLKGQRNVVWPVSNSTDHEIGLFADNRRLKRFRCGPKPHFFFALHPTILRGRRQRAFAHWSSIHIRSLENCLFADAGSRTIHLWPVIWFMSIKRVTAVYDTLSFYPVTISFFKSRFARYDQRVVLGCGDCR
jgi:hypothetical protein